MVLPTVHSIVKELDCVQMWGVLKDLEFQRVSHSELLSLKVRLMGWW